MQNADRDSKPGVGPRNLTPVFEDELELIEMETLPVDEYFRILEEMYRQS